MRIEPLSPPAHPPVLMAELKSHLRISHDDEDASLAGLIAAATDTIEQVTGLMLTGRIIDLYFSGWPVTGDLGWWDGVREGAMSDLAAPLAVSLPVRPARTLVAIERIGEDGSSIPVATEGFYLRAGLDPALCRLRGTLWPKPARAVDGIRVRVEAGFGADWNGVPAALRQAVLKLAAHFHVHRGDGDAVAPLDAAGIAPLLAPYRKVRL